MDIALFERVGGKCLNCAANLLDAEKTPTAGTVGAVGKLVDVAIAVERLNLSKIEQSSTAALKLEDEKPEDYLKGKVTGVWSMNDEVHPFERLRNLTDCLGKHKRVRVIFDYDPNWENAHVSVWGLALSKESRSSGSE
ncbi:MAG: hypothetical protein LIO57_01705 [Oscillospiraceae bacterium]|nr:hypothetical protein [Oscillospiraceae bacterium]